MSAALSPIRILSVDDHPILLQGVAALVSGQGDMSVVAEASNGREAIQQFRAHHPDITLMDLQMPEMNGLDAMIAIRGEFPDARIIVLTTYVGDVQVLRALKVGARGYLLKNSLHKELLDAIRSVHAGKKALSTEASMQLAEHAIDDALTPAEIRVLHLIAEGNANKEIATQEHHFQTGSKRPYPCRDDWSEARDHRDLDSSKEWFRTDPLRVLGRIGIA
jgi:DNA-binding NarL/FixJ family response regulator